MAQGNHKLGKAKTSRGAAKRKQVKTVKKAKKGNPSVEHNKSIASASKAINKKNERLVAAKALNNGTSFFLKDIAEKGTSVARRQRLHNVVF
jgi:hypothetical protein